jgi:aquaporin Z
MRPRFIPSKNVAGAGIIQRSVCFSQVSKTKHMQTASRQATQRREEPEPEPAGAITTLARHWPEYASEAAAIGLFMISACAFGVLLEHPGSAVHQAIDSALVRRALAGLAMGTTAVALITSPIGQRSGAHMNPAVTLTYLSLGKVRALDAFFYMCFQFAGAVAGVLVAALLIGPPVAHSAVNYAVTAPGMDGEVLAWIAEFLISFVLMMAVLAVSNTRRFTTWTPYVAGCLVAAYITFENPLSGMSMNPARTLGSAFSAKDWASLWIYFTAPPLAMVLAGQVYRLWRGSRKVFCAKLHHHNNKRCIFRCNYSGL